MTKYHAQFSEDKLIDELGILPPHGFFVDCGCAWPYLNSGTAFLRDRGWDGASIDANPAYEKEWNGIAPFTCALIGDGRPIGFEINGIPELSRVGSGKIVPTRRLDDLLQFSPHVDFLCLDLEGHEWAALKTFDWKKNQPIVICSEYATYGRMPIELPDGCGYSEEKHAVEDYRVRDMLFEMGYRLRFSTIANMVFTK